MGRKLEWELSGKSDVPQKIAEAKSAMSGFQGASTAMGKKFAEAFKDIAVGFLAPVTLIHQAIGLIASQFERLQQFAQESREFAKDAQNAKYFSAGGREAILQEEARKKEAEAKQKGMFGTQLGYADFLANDPRGKQLMKDFGFRTITPITQNQTFLPNADIIANAFAARLQEKTIAQDLALRDDVRARIDAILSGDIAKRAAEEATANAASGPTAQKIAEVSGNVIGVGQSPQLDAMRQQVLLQEDMANSLRFLVEANQRQDAFRPEKGFDLGGMGSAGRTVFPR